MTESEVFQEARPWGTFRQFTHNEPSTVKIITVNKNEELSLQSHAKRTEFWHVLSGSGIVTIADAKHTATTGDEYIIPLSTKHRLLAGPDGIRVLEIATGNFDEDDIIRYEDIYGRVS
jgi:mannose-6-phosphate isomerase-like protein (cupin superfamily)